MVFLFLTLLLTLPYALLLVFFRRSWLKTSAESAVESKKLPTISIIIPARNEEENIADCLGSVLAQTYPFTHFEVIVIDDHSSDSTADIVKSFAGSNVRLISLSNYSLPPQMNSYKKFGIEKAIGLAGGEWIVTTDADCRVQSQWLETIAKCYWQTGADLIVAPVEMTVPARRDPWNVNYLQIFQCLDFMTLQGITGAVVKGKFANMCNGANLTYRKQVFVDVEGFSGIDHVASGDDMLLMEKISRAGYRISYLQSPDAIIATAPAPTVRDFLQQRIRWASKSTAYKDVKLQLVLLLVFLLNLWVAALGVMSFFIDNTAWWFLANMVVKVRFELYFLRPVARFFGKEHLLRWFIPAQPLHILYTIVAGTLGNFKTYEWKGRKVK